HPPEQTAEEDGEERAWSRDDRQGAYVPGTSRRSPCDRCRRSPDRGRWRRCPGAPRTTLPSRSPHGDEVRAAASSRTRAGGAESSWKGGWNPSWLDRGCRRCRACSHRGVTDTGARALLARLLVTALVEAPGRSMG